MTPRQCAAARALLGWPQKTLAAAAEVTPKTISNFEAGTKPQRATMLACLDVFAQNGIVWIGEMGVMKVEVD